MTLSRSQVNKAGRLLRKVGQGQEVPTREALRDALDTFDRVPRLPFDTSNQGQQWVAFDDGYGGC